MTPQITRFSAIITLSAIFLSSSAHFRPPWNVWLISAGNNSRVASNNSSSRMAAVSESHDVGHGVVQRCPLLFTAVQCGYRQTVGTLQRYSVVAMARRSLPPGTYSGMCKLLQDFTYVDTLAVDGRQYLPASLFLRMTSILLDQVLFPYLVRRLCVRPLYTWFLWAPLETGAADLQAKLRLGIWKDR